jgi:adenosylmethionine-8-amino-7-oxononanoate aminotransferase
MATTPQTVHEEHTGAPSALQDKARRHLWMHFTRMGAYDRRHEIPIIVRGEGSYVYDEHDKRYLDGLSALFCVNAGHGRTEIGEAAAGQIALSGRVVDEPVVRAFVDEVAALATRAEERHGVPAAAITAMATSPPA